MRQAETIVLQVRDVTGEFPDAWLGHNLRRLHIVSSHSARISLSGLIPPELCTLRSLEILTLQSTDLKGFASGCILNGSTTSLRELDLRASYNFRAHFSQIAHLYPNLTDLDGTGTALYGSTSQAQYLPLVSLILAGSRVEGDLGALAAISTLRFLNLWGTLTTGFFGDFFPNGTPKFAETIEVLYIGETQVSGSIPEAIGTLKNLKVLQLNLLQLTSLPESISELTSLQQLIMSNARLVDAKLPEKIGNLEKLTRLSISQCNLTGTLPTSMSRLRNLKYLDLSGNLLEGPIPEELQAENIDLSSNALVGTIPSSVLSGAWVLNLHANSLGPTVGHDLISGHPEQGGQLLLSRNSFSGPLPNLSKGASFGHLDLSHNNFSGSIPTSMARVSKLELDFNQLSGGVESVLASPSYIDHLSVTHNDFNAPIPDLSGAPKTLRRINLSFNAFKLPLQPLPPTLLEFQISNNDLSHGEVDPEFAASAVLSPYLRLLDLSNTGVRWSMKTFYPLLFSNVTHLILRGTRMDHFTIPDLGSVETSALVNSLFNSLPTSSPFYRSFGPFSYSNTNFHRSPLEVLDLSDCGLGPTTFPNERSFDALQKFDISRNNFQGALFVERLMPFVVQINISGNNFEFDPSRDIHDLASLTTLDVSSNKLYGSLALANLPALQSADFGNNLFARTPYYASFQSHFRHYALRSLNIADNPRLPPYSGPLANIGLNKTLSFSPISRSHFFVANGGNGGVGGDKGLGGRDGGGGSGNHEDSSNAICYGLSFDLNRENAVFRYSEDLFSFHQCECDDNHFGLPAKACVECPLIGAETCRASNLTGRRHHFLFPVYKTIIGSSNGTQLNSSTYWSIQGEDCRYNLRQQISHRTNCIGASLPAASLFAHNASVENLLHKQCTHGSDGRLCSHCICTAEECWFDGGAICKKCAFVFSTKQSVPTCFGIAIVLFAIITVVFSFVLRSKRTFNNKPWEELKLAKRILHRLFLLISLGNIAIVISFLQLLAEIFHWDEYAIAGVLGVLNGSMEGIGLPCVIPFLRSQFNLFMVRIFLPYILIAFISAAAVFAEVLYEPSKFFRCLKRHREAPSDDEELLLEVSTTDLKVEYPLGALITSVSLTIIRFFYFGTAIAAFDNLFSLEQPYTRVLYSKNNPWMLFSDVRPFIYASIPILLLQTLVLPAAFVYLCLRLRFRYHREDVKIYLGTLFESFSPRFFWWEMINILRKLAMALIIRGLSSSSALQHLLIGLILATTTLAVLNLNPWRRKGENLADSISQLLLLLSLFMSRNGGLVQGSVSVTFVMVLDVGFVLASVGYVGFLTWTQPTAHHIRLASPNKAELQTLLLNSGIPSEEPASGFDEGEYSDMSFDSSR